MAGDPSPVPPVDRDGPESVGSPSIPLGSVFRTRLNLSHSAVLAAVILVGCVLWYQSQPGNVDLAHAAVVGTLFWMSGWLTQLIAYRVAARWFAVPLPTLTIGVVGVESNPRPWTATITLWITAVTFGAMMVLAAFYRWVEGDFGWPTLAVTPPQQWQVPSLGFDSHDSLWRSGAWLVSVQALCQMYPLPRTLGRQLYAALAALCSARLDIASQARVFRSCLLAIALVTLLVTMIFWSQYESLAMPRLLLLLLLSLMLWASTHRHDVPQYMSGFRIGWQTSGERQSMGRRWRQWWRARRQQALAAQAQVAAVQAEVQQHDEAVDAERLDEILQRLHLRGQQSLKAEDRQILQRVSDALRQQRKSRDLDG